MDIRRFFSVWATAAVTAAVIGCAGSKETPTEPTPGPAPVVPVAPSGPLDGVSITVTAKGLVIDPKSPFPIGQLRVYQGARLTFTNVDNVPHDILSDPFGLHNDCPEINAAGFLVPGQSRATDPLNRIMTCGFHDHMHEGDPAFGGKVTIEAR